jgi:deoxyribodipyrimidine photo-lyase
MTSAPPIIVWFRDDLRLSDHPALHAAANTGVPVICLYVHDEESPALKPPNARPRRRRAVAGAVVA